MGSELRWMRGLRARLTRKRDDSVASHVCNGHTTLQVAPTQCVAGVEAPTVLHDTSVVANCKDNSSFSTQPPPFPTLSCHFVNADAERMVTGSFQAAAAACVPHASVKFNSREPQIYETDLFAGKALILLRPATRSDDIYYAERVFDGRSRCVEFQVQGRFKRAPRGTVYLGGEVSNRVQLGMARTQLKDRQTRHGTRTEVQKTSDALSPLDLQRTSNPNAGDKWDNQTNPTIRGEAESTGAALLVRRQGFARVATCSGPARESCGPAHRNTGWRNATRARHATRCATPYPFLLCIQISFTHTPPRALASPTP